MDWDQVRLQQLYELFIRDEASPSELEEFWQHLEQHGVGPLQASAMKLYEENRQAASEKDWSGSLERILGHQAARKTNYAKRWLVAASILVVLGISGYLFLDGVSKNINEEIVAQAPVSPSLPDVKAPANSQATIILSDGSSISLDSTGSGKLAVQNDVALYKTDDGRIQYAGSSNERNMPAVYNTLVNPRGSKVVDLVLSDGTHLWLNAGSSVRFPVGFQGDTRKVSVTGEAYFEVAHDAERKFIVEANNVITEVLGTHFNINAYKEENVVRVTLLQGSVHVVSAKSDAMIRPGEQAVHVAGKSLRVKKDVNLDEVMAWKNQMFLFHDTNIRSIMNEVARWYNVEIFYQEGMSAFSDLNFGGSMSRQKNVSELLRRLEATEAVRFEVHGRNIQVFRMR